MDKPGPSVIKQKNIEVNKLKHIYVLEDETEETIDIKPKRKCVVVENESKITNIVYKKIPVISIHENEKNEEGASGSSEPDPIPRELELEICGQAKVLDKTKIIKKNKEIFAMGKSDLRRINRLIFEGIEVSLHLCNTNLVYFGPARLIDMLSQIISTAYVVNTSHWPLYSSDRGRCLCFCKIFDVKCRHQYCKYGSWLNIKRSIMEQFVFNKKDKDIFLRDFKMESKLRNKNHYRVTIKFKTNECFDLIHNVCYINPVFEIVFKLHFKPALYDFSNIFITFSPHPLFHRSYGFYFSNLLDYNTYNNNMTPVSYFLITTDSPKFTVVLKDAKIVKHGNEIK